MNTKVNPETQDPAKPGDKKEDKKPGAVAAKANEEGADPVEKAEEADAGEGEGDPADEGAEEGDKPDWRAELAGDDAEALKFYGRFTDRAALNRHIMLTEKRVREKGGIKPPAADAPVEEKAQFYTEHFGRPDTVEKLVELKIEPKLEEGEALGEDEATTMSGVLAMMQQAGVFGEEQMRAGAQIVADLVVGGRKEQEKKAGAFQEQAKKQLEKEWGRDFAANEAAAVSYMAMRCEQAGVDRRALANIKLANGGRLGDDPLFMQVMALGGRDHSEDPGMIRESEAGARAGELQAKLDAEMKKMKGTPAERRFYDSQEGKDLRAKLRADLKRMGAAAQPAKARK